MKALFKEKVTKFGSLISLIAVTALLAIFFLALPESLASPAGRIFATVWALTAILVFVAHARRLANERRYYSPYFAGIKARKAKKQDERRYLRG